MTRGQPVQVRAIVMGGDWQNPNVYAWLSGYTYVGEEPSSGCHLVKHSSGTFQGCIVRYREVRPHRHTEVEYDL